jgi:hypothetical protein
MGMGPVFVVAFRANEYLADRHCQEFLLKLSRTWKGKDPAASALVEQFHPLKEDEIKQARDLEAYSLQFIAGELNRVRLVKRNGVITLNPPPDDSLCESCHTKGWLKQEYRTSKIDGALAAIWLCQGCAKVDVKSQLKKLDDIESQLPKTTLPVLDGNPKLFTLMLDALEPAIKEVRQTGSMSPFVILETLASRRMQQSFKTARLELGYEEARKAILAAPPEATRYALAWLGIVTVGGVRYETILVGGGERGEEQGAAIGQRYKQHLPDVNYEPIGNLKVLGLHENVLTRSEDPDALLKLRPILTRLTVDIAHNQGPGHDEALTYEIKKCQAVYLNLGDLDRPFRKELQKEPDMVHVMIGRQTWITMFKPEAKEVVLARDTLFPILGAPPFPGFNEDGLIMIGYAPPKPKQGSEQITPSLFVLWATKFKIIGER